VETERELLETDGLLVYGFCCCGWEEFVELVVEDESRPAADAIGKDLETELRKVSCDSDGGELRWWLISCVDAGVITICEWGDGTLVEEAGGCAGTEDIGGIGRQDAFWIMSWLVLMLNSVSHPPEPESPDTTSGSENMDIS